MNWLNTEVVLHINEIDPVLRIISEKYDDNGSVVGIKSVAELEAEREQRQGKRQFQVTAVMKQKRLTVESRYGDFSERVELLAWCFGMISRAILP